MVHFFNRSASQAQDAALSRYQVSRRHYFGKRYGALGNLAYDLLSGLDDGHGQGHRFAEVDDLGAPPRPPDIEVPAEGAYLAEIAADPGFVFAAGRLDVNRSFCIPDAVWDGLAPATYFVRFLERRSYRILRTVCLTKTTPPVPISADDAVLEPAFA
jgi:hypothetical protein